MPTNAFVVDFHAEESGRCGTAGFSRTLWDARIRRVFFISRVRILIALSLILGMLAAPGSRSLAQEAPEPTGAEGEPAGPPLGTANLDGKTPAERSAALLRFVATVKPAAKAETIPRKRLRRTRRGCCSM
jgi:hypothetical protein